MSQKISLEEALSLINKIANKPFKELFVNHPEAFDKIVINKGKSGQILQNILLNLDLTSDTLDFSDGELKTVGWYKSKDCPKETMDITKLNEELDDFLLGTPFEESTLYQKIKNFLLVPVMKYEKSSSDSRWAPEQWYYKNPYHVSDNIEKYKDFYEQIKEDYYFIHNELKKELDNNGYIHTISGKYIQIRPHDSTKKKVFSKVYNRIITKEPLGYTYGFYLIKNGIKEIMRLNCR